MTTEIARPLLVKSADGRTLAVREMLDHGLVLDNLTAARRLGELRGDLTPFLIEDDGRRQVVIAGDGGAAAQFVFSSSPATSSHAECSGCPAGRFGVEVAVNDGPGQAPPGRVAKVAGQTRHALRKPFRIVVGNPERRFGEHRGRPRLER